MSIDTFCGALRAHQYRGLSPGPRLIVLGAVHGNETAGTRAIARIVDDIDGGRLPIERGRLTLLPVANPLAYQRGQRAGERNLNRNLRPSAIPQDYEDRVANALCPWLAEHDVLLDLHSFQAQGVPFVVIGPSDNDGPIEPFARAAEESRLAVHLGPSLMLEGWLDAYSRGVERRRQRAAASPAAGAALTLDANYGVGTTEYMRAAGGYAVTLECGQHGDPAAPDVGYRAIGQALALLRIAPVALEPPVAGHELIRLAEVYDRLHAQDRFTREWKSFDAVRAGEPIGLRHDGSAVEAPADGRVVFPNSRAEVGQEWFYFAVPSTRRL